MHSKRPFLAHLPDRWLRWLVQGRNALLSVLEPFDRLWLAINGKRPWPPLALRRYVGPLSVFESSAAEYVTLLKLLARLERHHRVLDLGCGCGALALQLRGYLQPERGGEYIGVDIHQPSIRWCQRALAGPGFTFVWFNAYSAAFNPSGERAFDYQAALAPFQPVNVAVAKSLFTHLRPETCLAYLQAVRRVLAPEGAFLFSAFTYASESDLAGAEIAFRFGEGCFRHAYAERVESAVAFDERWLKDVLSEAGFALDAFYPGTWRASGAGLSFQDVFVVRPNHSIGCANTNPDLVRSAHEGVD